jgi:dTMP kinase
MTPLALKPGTLLVLEGLDKTGKSTQSQALRDILDPAKTRHVHMPSGLNAFTDETYSMLESPFRAPASGVARQLAHLACHAESVPNIQELLTDHAVVLDRWWWSTLAYGWYSGDFPNLGVTEQVFRNLIDSIWSPLAASVVFLFDKPYQHDANNSDPILAGYHEIAEANPALTVRLPQGAPDVVTGIIVAALRDRDLLEI